MACGDLFPAMPAPPAPVQPGVSARHEFPSGGGAFNGLGVRARGYDVTVSWRAGGAEQAVASADGGASFSSLPPALLASATPPTRSGLVVEPDDDGRWKVSGTGELRAHEPVSVELPPVPDAVSPVAFDEYCGLLSVVTVEATDGGRRLSVHRFLSPRNGGRGALVGAPVPVAELADPSAPGDIVVGAVPDAAVVAWVEGERLHAVRVELPGVVCAPLT